MLQTYHIVLLVPGGWATESLQLEHVFVVTVEGTAAAVADLPSILNITLIQVFVRLGQTP